MSCFSYFHGDFRNAALSHNISISGLDKDVVDIRQNIHEVFTSHSSADSRVITVVFPFFLRHFNFMPCQLANERGSHVPGDNSSMSRSPASNDNLGFVCGEACLIPSLKIDRILEFTPIGHQLFPFKLFWEFPVKRLQMELLPDFIHLGHSLRVLKSNTLGGCVLQGFVHQRQDGLLSAQSHPRTDQPLCFRALSGDSKAIAAAAAKWVLGIKSEFARPAPVTADAFHIHLAGALSSLVGTGALPGL